MNIMASASFQHMLQVLFWGSFITGSVLIISYFTGNLSHPLTRALKRVSKLRVKCLALSSKLEGSGQSVPNRELIRALRQIMKSKKSVLSSINVYIYDDNKKNMNQGAVKSALSRIETNCKESLTSAMEKQYPIVKERMDENAEIALDLYKTFKSVIVKETEDKIMDL